MFTVPFSKKAPGNGLVVLTVFYKIGDQNAMLRIDLDGLGDNVVAEALIERHILGVRRVTARFMLHESPSNAGANQEIRTCMQVLMPLAENCEFQIKIISLREGDGCNSSTRQHEGSLWGQSVLSMLKFTIEERFRRREGMGLTAKQSDKVLWGSLESDFTVYALAPVVPQPRDPSYPPPVIDGGRYTAEPDSI